ncbi:hypothetical protein NXS19_013972 [Fusarium pseudograminearum]|uniref:Uncharacterized protein n=1 Tax=Fusarium pseudograminearum (strain CS3096) TaxID=1028729 RepID=K3VY83_FUSPC|nr:hypothetical protein FPSE_09726 [Fusarium pseudograminearum CS3096]EKJ70200.1 hypothetical protein FPSE_09726 [Fusarium pseudograminearum CS3096]UZP46160.1 hypothetical protein NXS19_013972 [Fusarium pseudograminearum]
MCKWDIFLFNCNCFTLGLKEHCHQHRLKQTANCNEVQQVREAWVYRQNKVCQNHTGQEETFANGPTVTWSELESKVYQLAKEYAAKGDFPGRP